ncbi:Cupredoxin [Calycina marina]|uniref:Cupredoxin n=1 Tax=Calycina marina TaxID=1763456 RepID=A0A9P7Z7X0_9HELO|nr:Cupredoxin [Calycina marina]
MQYTNFLIGLSSVAVATAAAPPAVTATSSPFKVSVGEDGLTYTPSNIIAPVGTKITFDFYPKNHTVTQSSFADPCHPLAAGGFFSDFNPTKAGTEGNTFTITVEDTKPIWFYCSQTTGSHCQAGMVGAINAKQSGNVTLDAFITLAKNATTSTFPEGGISGGVLSTFSATASSGISLPTYTAASTTLSTFSGTFPGPTSSPTTVETGGASSRSASLFGIAVLFVGAASML